MITTVFSAQANSKAEYFFWDNGNFAVTNENWIELRTHFEPLRDKTKVELVEIAKKKYPAILEFVTKLDPEMGKRLEKEKVIEKMIATPESRIKEYLNNFCKSYAKMEGAGRTGGSFLLESGHLLIYPDHYLRKFFRCQKFRTDECMAYDSNLPLSNYWPILD